MRVAIAGKGGAGKTTLSATLARLVARTGRPVVAIDADANPNLGYALGMSAQSASALEAVPSSSVSRRRGGPGLNVPIDDVIARYAVIGPDGVRLMGMGSPAHADEGCLCSAHAVVSSLLEDLGGRERFVVVDMEASPEHVSRGTIRHADAVWLIAEPYYRSLETVRRMAALIAELNVPTVAVVGNKVRTADDRAAIAELCQRHGLAFAGSVPWSDDVIAADRDRASVIDRPGALPVVAAVTSLAKDLGA